MLPLLEQALHVGLRFVFLQAAHDAGARLAQKFDEFTTGVHAGLKVNLVILYPVFKLFKVEAVNGNKVFQSVVHDERNGALVFLCELFFDMRYFFRVDGIYLFRIVEGPAAMSPLDDDLAVIVRCLAGKIFNGPQFLQHAINFAKDFLVIAGSETFIAGGHATGEMIAGGLLQWFNLDILQGKVFHVRQTHGPGGGINKAAAPRHGILCLPVNMRAGVPVSDIRVGHHAAVGFHLHFAELGPGTHFVLHCAAGVGMTLLGEAEVNAA